MFFSAFIAIFFGLIIGNVSTTFFFRMANNISSFGMLDNNVGRRPFCSSCGHNLKFYEYMPPFNWFFSGNHCNYCGIKINPLYHYIEISNALVSLALYLIVGMNEEYLLLYSACALTIFLMASNYYYGKIYFNLLYILIFLGCIYRTLVDISIYTWVNHFAWGFILFMILKKFLQVAIPLQNIIMFAIICAWFDGDSLIAAATLLCYYAFLQYKKQQEIFYISLFIAMFLVIITNLIALPYL